MATLPAPEPAAGLAAYERERELALARDLRTLENYRRYVASGRRSAAVDYLPIKLDIENVSRCNFRCTMCVVADWHKGRRAADMPLARFKRLIDEQYGLVEIKLQGIGEPLLQRDEFFEMIRYARARHIWVRTTTNASLLHLNDNARKLIDSGVNEVQISIDAASPSAYEAIRVGSVYRQVMRNCALINDYCRSLGIERTKMWTVVQRGNVDELEKIVGLAAELGFTNQVFSLELSDWAQPHMRQRNESEDVHEGLSDQVLLELVRKGQAVGVKVSFWRVQDKYQAGMDPKALCPWPFERAFVSSDLRIVPCCYVGNPDVFQLDGGIGDAKTFTDVWHGPDFERFRAAHLAGAIPEVCRACYRRFPATS